MKYNEFLIERVINLHTPEQKIRYLDLVTSMIYNSYKEIGGFKHIKDIDELRKELEKLAQEDGMWKLIKRNDHIVSAGIYRYTPFGRKTIGTASSGDFIGKRGVYQIKGEDIKNQRTYAEVSGKIEHISINKFNATKIPNKFAELILGKEVHPDEDGFHYTRDINGVTTKKVLIGRIDDDLLKKLEQERDKNHSVIFIDKIP